MLRLLTKHYRLLRGTATALVVTTIILGVLWYLDPQGNYEPAIYVIGTLATLVGLPTIAEAVASSKLHVAIKSIGDDGKQRPEVLIIGLTKIEEKCFFEIPITVESSGQSALKNVAVRVQLPKKLVPEVPPHSQPVENQTLRFEISPRGDQHVSCNFFIPSLRVNEPSTVPFPLLIHPTDWISVESGGPRIERGNWSMSVTESETPIQVIAVPVSATVFSDNAHPVVRKWVIWMTPSKNQTELQQLAPSVITVARIWERGQRAYRLPVLGSIVVIPSALIRDGRDQPVAVSQFRSKPSSVGTTVYEPGSTYLPVQASRYLVANPPAPALFRLWIRDVYAKRPEYYK